MDTLSGTPVLTELLPSPWIDVVSTMAPFNRRHPPPILLNCVKLNSPQPPPPPFQSMVMSLPHTPMATMEIIAIETTIP